MCNDSLEFAVWQRSHALVLAIYEPTPGCPADERCNLVSQIRRAVLSVATNVAERSKRSGVSGLCALS